MFIIYFIPHKLFDISPFAFLNFYVVLITFNGVSQF